VTEITLYSMRSGTLSQWSVSESGWHQKTWVLQRRHEQVSFEYAGGDLIGFLEDHNIVNKFI